MGYSQSINVADSVPVAEGTAASVESKLLGLEIVRFTCAFAVLVWHYQHFYDVSGAPAFVQSAQPLHGLFAIFYHYGKFGVQIFWGISGFIFFWKYGNAIAQKAVSARKFFWLRMSRLYPLHFVTLVLIAALQPIHIALTGDSFVYRDNNASNFVAQLFMATHWGKPAPFTFNGPIWSVSAEVFVYALFFLIVRRFGAGWGTIAGSIALGLLAQMAGLSSPVLLCICFFFAGGAAARLFVDSQQAGDPAKLLMPALIGLVAIGAGSWLRGTTLDEQNIVMLLLVGMPPLLLIAAQDWTILDRWPRLIQAAGNMTYSTYLVHFPLQLLVAIAFAATGIIPPVQAPIFLVAYLAVTMVAGRMIFLRFERPAQDWIRRKALPRRPVLA